MGAAGKYTPTTAMWRSRILDWSRTWPRKGPIVCGRRRNPFVLLQALMGLADRAMSNGNLHGQRDWWTLPQLANVMGVSRNTAREILQWLEQTEWLESAPQPFTSEGTRQPTIRKLVIPVQLLNTNVGLGTPSKSDGAHVQESGAPRPINATSSSNGGIQTLDDTFVPFGPLDPLGGGAADGEAFKSPHDIAAEIKQRKGWVA